MRPVRSQKCTPDYIIPRFVSVSGDFPGNSWVIEYITSAKRFNDPLIL